MHSAFFLKKPYVPDAELRPYRLMGAVAQVPVRPTSPQIVTSVAAPHLRFLEKRASTCSMFRPAIGLSLLTNTASESSEVRTGVGL